ncbi:MAG: hypothetical protein GY861_10525, partial [bacterium]|nr:hypothetical protein [bacterium]
MPAQTTTTSNIYFPDGALVGVKAEGDGSYTDVGAISTAVTATLNWNENQFETANAGKTDKQVKELTIEGGFTLINLNPTGVQKLSGGLFEEVTVAGTSVTSIDNQVIASGAASDVTPYSLVITETSADPLIVSSALVIASVTGATDGALTANDDYTIIDDAGSYSGKAIVFNTAGTNLTTMAQVITIVYTSVTPVASTTIYCGTSTYVLSSYAMQITHTDTDGKIRRLELYSVDPNSGGFQFNFKGANEDGTEEMPLTYTARIDTSLTD